jgi:hypothetical protein
VIKAIYTALLLKNNVFVGTQNRIRKRITKLCMYPLSIRFAVLDVVVVVVLYIVGTQNRIRKRITKLCMYPLSIRFAVLDVVVVVVVVFDVL